MKRIVSSLPPALQQRLSDTDLIVFDGECVLCSGFFRFMQAADRRGRFRFATAQSELGQALYAALALPLRDFETNLVIVDGCIHEKLDSFAAAMRALSWPWRALAALGWLPGAVKAPLYGLIARNRYRFFGRREACLIPDAALRARFAPGGWG